MSEQRQQMSGFPFFVCTCGSNACTRQSFQVHIRKIELGIAVLLPVLVTFEIIVFVCRIRFFGPIY